MQQGTLSTQSGLFHLQAHGENNLPPHHVRGKLSLSRAKRVWDASLRNWHFSGHSSHEEEPRSTDVLWLPVFSQHPSLPSRIQPCDEDRKTWQDPQQPHHPRAERGQRDPGAAVHQPRRKHPFWFGKPAPAPTGRPGTARYGFSNISNQKQPANLQNQ